MAQVNPIVFIPPTVLLLAIIGILIYRYFDTVQDTYYNILYRIRERNRDGTAVGDEEEEESFDEESEDVEQEEIYAHDQLGGDDDDQDEIEPQGSTTSARLRMHHEMVQQMRARAGFAPEPFPGDEDENVGGGDGDEEGEEGETEDDGGVGSSTGAMAGASAGRIKKIGKKKAEKLQRKEQMRAYREFMDMQREERRQQEELFKIQESIQQEERRRKRSAQIEKDRKRKELLKEKEAKEKHMRIKQLQSEKAMDEKARRELRAYIQRVKSFRLSTLAKQLGRTEAQLLRDLAVVAQDEDLEAGAQDTAEGSDVPRITLVSSLAVASPPSSPSISTRSSHGRSSRPQLLVLYDSGSDRYVVLNESQLKQFSETVKSKGRVSKEELSVASEGIFRPTPSIK